MSINPVHGIVAAADGPPAQPANRLPSSAASEAQLLLPRSKSGAEPKQEVPTAARRSQSSEIPQDEVQVQRDSASNGQIVIKYLDHSGQVILQIPSSQVLGLARAIEQALEEQSNRRASTSQVTLLREGVNSNGH